MTSEAREPTEGGKAARGEPAHLALCLRPPAQTVGDFCLGFFFNIYICIYIFGPFNCFAKQAHARRRDR